MIIYSSSGIRVLFKSRGGRSVPGLGTIANSVAIIVGAVLGVFCKRGLPEKWQETMMSSIALCIAIIGIQMALKTQNIVVVIFSLVLGAITGEIIDIEGAMNRLGNFLGDKLSGNDASAAAAIGAGFVNASILFCSGAMAILGSIQDGLAADHTTLYAKATLDGLISLILSANVGIGVALSAISVGISPAGEPLLDLCYEEDSAGVVDMNVVMTGEGQFVEVQGTGEGRPFSREEMNRLLELAEKGIDELISYEKDVLGNVLVWRVGRE